MSEYNSRTNDAVNKVLIEIGQVLGSYRDALVLVGGIVPSLLLPDADPPHIGTIDIDLMLNPAKLKNRYATVVQLLQDADYTLNKPSSNKPSSTTFQLYKDVSVDNGPTIKIVVDLLRPAGKLKKNKPKLVDGLRVQEIDGGEVALEHNQEVTLEGIDIRRRRNTVKIYVITIPGILALKGNALQSRESNGKDAYDIYHTVRNYPEGPIALAKACKELLKDPEVVRSYGYIDQKWKAYDYFGPKSVQQFLDAYPDMGNLQGDELQRDAFEQVRAWLDALSS